MIPGKDNEDRNRIALPESTAIIHSTRMGYGLIKVSPGVGRVCHMVCRSGKIPRAKGSCFGCTAPVELVRSRLAAPCQSSLCFRSTLQFQVPLLMRFPVGPRILVGLVPLCMAVDELLWWYDAVAPLMLMLQS